MPILSLILLLLAGSLEGLAAGQPWAGPALKGDPVVAETPDPLQPTLGEHGTAVWYWPDLPADTVAFRCTFTVPVACEFRGLRLVTFGGQSDNPARGFWNLRLRVGGALLYSEDGILFDGSGQAEDYLPSLEDSEQTVPLAPGQNLTVELERSHGNEPPFLSADGDCQFQGGQQSAIRLAGGGWQAIGRDLCLKVLVDFPGADPLGPALEFGRLPDWPLANGSLPLRIRARDTAGVALVEASAWQAGGDTLSLPATLAGTAGSDWLVSLPLGGFDLGPLSLRIHGLDSLGNTSDSLRTLELVEGDYLWSGASGRVDDTFTPGWPLLSGMATAVRIGLEDFPSGVDLQGFVPVGGRSLLTGQGSCRMRLVPDAGGSPRTAGGNWLDAVTPVALAGIDDCGGWRDFLFGPVPDSLRSSAAWWVIQEYNTGDALFVAAEVPRDSLESTGSSWNWDPQAGEWQALTRLNLLHQVRVAVESCDAGLPFVADFDSSYVDLGCWDRERVASGSQGWLLASREGPTNPRSTYFAPLGDPDGSSTHGQSAASDTLHAPSTIVYINSDAQPSQDLQDSLLTPWISFGASTGLRASFFSYYGHLGGVRAEEAFVIRRVRDSAGTVGPWQVLATGEELGAYDTLELPELDPPLRPVWKHHDLPVGGLLPGGSLQLGFVYSGLNSYGWALDDLRIQAPASQAMPEGNAVVRIERTWPNPFNPSTTIEFVLREAGPVQVAVYNLLGQQVARLLDERLVADEYRVQFQADGFSSGIYLVRIASRGHEDWRRILLVK
jgi:hypothetical protein